MLAGRWAKFIHSESALVLMSSGGEQHHSGPTDCLWWWCMLWHSFPSLIFIQYLSAAYQYFYRLKTEQSLLMYRHNACWDMGYCPGTRSLLHGFSHSHRPFWIHTIKNACVFSVYGGWVRSNICTITALLINNLASLYVLLKATKHSQFSVAASSTSCPKVMRVHAVGGRRENSEMLCSHVKARSSRLSGVLSSSVGKSSYDITARVLILSENKWSVH